MDAASEVKARLNVEDVVAQYVQLKRAGRNFKGLSPFTNEKTASFMVSPEKQIWHDFSSGKGGDIFSFVMEMEGLDFRGALELLARQAGVELEQFKGRDASAAKLKSRLAEALELGAKFYQTQLKASPTAIGYLGRDRGFSKQTILDWQLGYSPNASRGLADFLTRKGFNATELKRAGLAVDRRGGLVDMFRGRIMIPLADAQGQVIGFTARLLQDDANAPKYINTPASPLYDKSRHIYGLHLAKEAIRKQKFAVVAEGNLDVIASHQAGVANVVASAGTAMTSAHLTALKRFTPDIRLSFDADRAGLEAVERIIPLAQKAGVNLKIISLPAGAKDPDELIKQKGVKSWQQAIDQAVYAVDWLIERYQKQLDLKTAQGKKTFTDVLLVTVKRLNDPVEQEHYIKQIAALTDSSPEAVAAKLRGTSGEEPLRLKKAKPQPVADDKTQAEYQRFQDHLLAIAFFEPEARPLLPEPLEIFSEGPARQLAKFLKTHPETKITQKLSVPLKQIADYVKICSLQFEELYDGLEKDELLHQAEGLRQRLLNSYVRLERAKVMTQMEVAKPAEMKRLMGRANQLNQLIKQKG